MSRLNKILVGLVVVQLALAVFVLTRDDEVHIAPMAPVLAGFDSAKVTRLQIFDKGADKPALELVKELAPPAAGSGAALAEDRWKLASGFDHPVDATKVGDLLAKLAGMKSRGPIATSPLRHDQLAVGDKTFEKKLVITTPGGEVTLLVGGASGGRSTAVRVAGNAKVYGVTGLTAWGININANQWIDPAYLAVDKASITRLAVQTPAGTTELAKAAAGWELSSLGQPVALPPGQTLDAAAVDRVVAQAATWTIYKPGDPKRDAATPTATISIWTAAPDPAANASVERAPDHVIDVVLDGTDYWVKDRAASTAGMIGKSGLDALVEVSRDKLLGKPAPAPGPGGAGAPRPTPTPGKGPTSPPRSPPAAPAAPKGAAGGARPPAP